MLSPAMPLLEVCYTLYMTVEQCFTNVGAYTGYHWADQQRSCYRSTRLVL